MSEAVLQRPSKPDPQRPAPERRPALAASWGGERDRSVTAYDELWFPGRPHLP